MLPELGLLSLCFAAVMAVLLCVVPLWGFYQKQPHFLRMSHTLSYLYALFVTISLVLLAYSFAVDDFSLMYVAQHSNSDLPIFYKLAATWGGHEGSMLFWLFALAFWTAIFAYFNRQTDLVFTARTLMILGGIGLAFSLFILLLSNPFERLFPVPPQGRDLNPMLQDVGLIFHPPLLYLGYVGFAINFAMTVSALIGKNFDAAFARRCRPWVLLSWTFLTAGISLGSWWAYYELGWGGWWFWDPVENASLMPWLVATALLHTLVVSEQRGIFNYWLILFSIFCFALSLLGTFIVRSGILTSVHAFSVDPDRGTALLAIFAALTLGALTLFALRVELPSSLVRFKTFSKESALLLLNILFAVATLAVFIGTFYPLVFSMMGWGSISVGAPYFNRLFIPLVVLLLLLMLFAPSLRWKQQIFSQNIISQQITSQKVRYFSTLFITFIVAMGSGTAIIYYHLQQNSLLSFNWLAFILLSLAIWIVLFSFVLSRKHLLTKRLAMLLAHSGLAVTVTGAVMSSFYGAEIGVRLSPNETVTLQGYQFKYLGAEHQIGPNYTAERATFIISHQQQKVAEIYPERRYYDVRTMNMSEVGIDWGVWGDLYIVMGDKSEQQFAFRLHYKPFVRWIWFGGLLMIVGALLAMLSLKRRQSMSN